MVAREANEREMLRAPDVGDDPTNSEIVCPVCGAKCVQRRCKVVCESEQCRGRVVLNCSEF